MSVFWNFKIKAGSRVAEIYIYNVIGRDFYDEAVSAKKFVNELNDLKGVEELHVRINSPGGSVFEGLAIYNALLRFEGKVITHVDGLAASMASAVFMAGEERYMGESTMLMIHDPWTAAMGNAADFRRLADLLDKTKEGLVGAYLRGASDKDEVSKLMSEETWFTASEAVEKGFATASEEQRDVEASWELPEGMEALMSWKNTPSLVATAMSSGKWGGSVKEFEQSAQNLDESGDPQGSFVKPTAQAVNRKVKSMDDKDKLSDKVTDTADVNARAVAEFDRQKEIRAVFSSVKGKFDDVDFAKIEDVCLNDMNCSAEDARKLVFAEIGKNNAPSSKPPRIEFGATDKEKAMTGITASIEFRAGLRNKRDEGNEFSSFTLTDIARHCLQMNNVSHKGMDRMMLVGAAMTSTSDFPKLLANTANKSLLMGYEEAPETYQLWTRRGNLTDFKTATRNGLSLFDEMEVVHEGGEYKMGTFTEVSESIKLLTYGRKFSISRQAIINDDLGAFTTVPRRMGRAARRKVGDLAYGVLTANAALSDNVALFHASHGNLAGSGAAISTTSVSARKAAMRKQKDPKGKGVLNIMSKYLIVPVALEDHAMTFIGSETDFSQANPGKKNIHRSTLEVVSEARLDENSATAWYLGADANLYDTVEVAFLDGNDAPTLEQQNGWDVDGVEFKVRIDAAAKALDFRAMQKDPGA